MPKIRAKKIKSRKIKEDDSDEGVYTVEKIMEKKLKKGRVMYLIKWEGYSNQHNTWEWEEDCNCPELIEQFEKDRKLEKTKGADLILSNKKERPSPKLHADSTNTLQDEKGTSGNHTRSDPAPMPPKKTGFERGLEPEKILGATEQNGKLIFLIKWYVLHFVIRGSTIFPLIRNENHNIYKCWYPS